MRANMEILHVSKQYKNGVTALEDVSFCVGSGVFGLLGHNGAGKTTLMKALVTVLKPSAGTIRVCGFDTAAQGKEVRARVGYLPQELAMYPSLSVWDFVNYMAQIKGIREQKDRQRGAGRGGNAGILPAQNRAALRRHEAQGGHSAGADWQSANSRGGRADGRARPGGAGAVPRPAVAIRQRGTHGFCSSTHIVEDIHQLCGELAVLRKGRLFYAGTSATLLERVRDKVKILRLENEAQLVELQKKAVVLSTTYESRGLAARIMDEDDLYMQAQPVAATLEDAYVYCMGGKAHA